VLLVDGFYAGEQNMDELFLVGLNMYPKLKYSQTSRLISFFLMNV
jgi:hypothetical protein